MATQEQKIIFRKMEEILYSYNKYVNKIKKEQEALKEPQIIQTYSIEKLIGSGYVTVKSEVERIEELKERLLNDITRHEEILFRIESALEMVKDHKDYNFIQLKYFDNRTYEEIADVLNISLKSTYGMRNRILGALEIHFKTQKMIEF